MTIYQIAPNSNHSLVHALGNALYANEPRVDKYTNALTEMDVLCLPNNNAAWYAMENCNDKIIWLVGQYKAADIDALKELIKEKVKTVKIK